MRRLLSFCVVVLVFTALAAAQRLPQTALPKSYELKFTPDFSNNTFAGEETIQVQVPKTTSEIVLNAADITFEKVTIAAGSSTQTAKVTLRKADEMANLSVGTPLQPGPASIHIVYSGILNNELRGFYLGHEENGHKYAATQFEATDARRAFPSFDEPDYKATFDVTVVAPKEDTVISNTDSVSDIPNPSDSTHTVRFAKTPKMSTYLVAIVVGEFESVQGSADGIPIRVWTTPGKKDLASFALADAEQCMHFYNDYFGIKYPYGKLDLIGLPDFAAGAMENTAAITFREVVLLLNEKTATESAKKEVAEVIDHEMAHQWFGDLVTMKWWDDIWLNEGFATWMESKPVTAWKPEWNIKQDDVLDTIRTLNVDSLENTRPIHQAASTPAQIQELFDGIAYGKAAAVLRMLEAYLGPDGFRAGVNQYLKQHAYGNATASDFWTTLTQVTKKPVNQIMPTFVEQPGEPMVLMNAQCSGGNTNVKLSQKRYFDDRTLFNASRKELWSIPSCMRSGSGPQKCELLTQKEASLSFPGCSQWVLGNSGASGYYRSGYTTPIIRAIAPHVEKDLTPGERIFLLGDEWASVRVGRQQIGDYMTLAEGLQSDRNRPVMQQLTDELQYIGRYLVSRNDATGYQQWVQRLLTPIAKDLGWQARPGDSDEQKDLRAEVFYTLGYTAKDPQVLAEANRIANQYLTDPQRVDHTMVYSALRLAAMNGDANLYDHIVAAMGHVSTPQDFYMLARSLTFFSSPQLVDRTLNYALSPKVRSQDAAFIIAGVMETPGGEQEAWDFTRNHWPQIDKLMGGFASGGLVAATSSFCSADMQKQVQDFFSTHKVPSAERTLRQSLERMRDCIDLKSQQSTQLSSWLQHRNQTAGE
jgi:aminopeptidase N